MKNNIVCVLFLLLALYSCKDMNKVSAGNYPYAEIFNIDQPKSKVIHKIDSLKSIDKDLCVPAFKWAGKDLILKDSIQENGYFTFYIFNKEKKQIIQSYLIENSRNTTEIGLVSYHNGLSLGNWKIVNHSDLSTEENNEIKNIFKELIIDKIK